jgi:hypothetical protein
MKYLTLLATLLAATALGLAFRNGMYGPATASAGNNQPSDFALGLSPARPVEPAERPRDVAAKAPADLLGCAVEQRPGSSDLLLARIANECGSFLLQKASPADPRLLKQAAAHFRACLSHETSAGGAAPVFADARRKLEQAERLLAQANRPARVERPAPAPVARPAPTAAAPAAEKKTAAVPPPPAPRKEPTPPAPRATARPEAVMVGPDGVIYRRVEESR